MKTKERKYIVDDTLTGDKADNNHIGYTVDDIDFILSQFILEEKKKTEKDKRYKGKTGLAIIVGDNEETELAVVFGHRLRKIVEDLSAMVRDHKNIHDLFMNVLVNCAKRGYIDVEISGLPAAEKSASKQLMS